MNPTVVPDPIDVRPAIADRWPDVVTVMGTRGDPSWCWCQWFRLDTEARRSASPADNRAALRGQVISSSVPPGVIAYRGDDPVGWCAIGPKQDYARLAASPTGDPASAGVWSLTCFVVRVGHRRQGISRQLLAGAIELAGSHGARAVEAYPVNIAKRRSVSSAELFRGPLSLFISAGFAEIGRSSPARAIVRLDLDGGSERQPV
jgi:GNAT superfamily N-acetyltransferase